MPVFGSISSLSKEPVSACTSCTLLNKTLLRLNLKPNTGIRNWLGGVLLSSTFGTLLNWGFYQLGLGFFSDDFWCVVWGGIWAVRGSDYGLIAALSFALVEFFV